MMSFLSFASRAAANDLDASPGGTRLLRFARNDKEGRPFTGSKIEDAMSTQSRTRRLSASQIQKRKGGDKLVCLTAYTASVARHLDEEVDLLLVGDSLGMTVYGFDSTLPVTLDIMVAHGAAVVRSTRLAHVVVDLPFGSYQGSPEQAFRAAARVMAETGCGSVKLEGGEEMAETVGFLARRGIPVMGHVGLTPQAVNALGGYRSRGHEAGERDKILRDGLMIAKGGAYSLVIEGVAESLARELTEAVAIPTIGIGGSPACDGQILVIDDMLGLFAAFTPKFVKRYRMLGEEIRAAAREYAEDVRHGRFPAEEHTYPSPKRAKPAE
jgi:3-methyl-2-oxobutanoate hydroxymethyltransferase